MNYYLCTRKNYDLLYIISMTGRPLFLRFYVIEFIIYSRSIVGSKSLKIRALREIKRRTVFFMHESLIGVKMFHV